jgi:hypothetical protein
MNWALENARCAGSSKLVSYQLSVSAASGWLAPPQFVTALGRLPLPDDHCPRQWRGPF